ncbi:MAG: hypothetical protein ACJ72U_08445, partial [Nitrososphaeraceae archaeon]
MTTFSKPANALILIIGGYILQGALIWTSLKATIRIRSRSLPQRKKLIEITVRIYYHSLPLIACMNQSGSISLFFFTKYPNAE